MSVLWKSKKTALVIALKIGFKPFTLSLSKGRSWFDKLTTNGVLNVGYYGNSIFILRGEYCKCS
jgi:hypothetical protein